MARSIHSEVDKSNAASVATKPSVLRKRQATPDNSVEGDVAVATCTLVQLFCHLIDENWLEEQKIQLKCVDYCICSNYGASLVYGPLALEGIFKWHLHTEKYSCSRQYMYFVVGRLAVWGYMTVFKDATYMYILY